MSAALKPHASAAAATLRAAALTPYDPLKDVVGSVARAVIRLRSVEDIVELFAAVDQMSMAAEALAEAAVELHRAADGALLDSMQATGCTGFATAHHNVTVAAGPPSVDILDAKAVPEELMSQPKPSPDRAKIKAALKAGEVMNWAKLVEGKPHLRRNATK